MKSYWLWLIFNMIIWTYAFAHTYQTNEEIITFLFAASLYFILFFIIPLVQQKPKILISILSIKSIIAFILFFPEQYIPLILVQSLLIAEGFYRLTLKHSLALGGVIAAIQMILIAISTLNPYIKIGIIIYIVLLFTAMIFYKKTKEHSDDLEARYAALLSEYRNLKRRIVSEEEATRQEERMLIAHEIHDSVGHKLTALLMQLEGFRIKASEKDKPQVTSLKALANKSLEETRRAVKSLKMNETGGLPGILRLIRKLEMESFMRIHFSVKYGAFTAPLSGEESFVIYRSVQEALTNIMKHSQAREAEIQFEAPGGSIFRFEINNPITDNRNYQEGFGLTSMRERLEKFGGGLEVYQTEEQFIVRGFIKIGTGD